MVSHQSRAKPINARQARREKALVGSLLEFTLPASAAAR
jgi:hypothetical protein